MKRGTFLRNLVGLALVPKTIQSLDEIEDKRLIKFEPEKQVMSSSVSLGKNDVLLYNNRVEVGRLEKCTLNIERAIIDVTTEQDTWMEHIANPSLCQINGFTNNHLPHDKMLDIVGNFDGQDIIGKGYCSESGGTLDGIISVTIDVVGQITMK